MISSGMSEVASEFRAERTPSLVMVTDRVPDNFDAVIDHETSGLSRRFPLQLTGLITPGFELDSFGAVETRMRLLERHLGETMLPIPVVRQSGGGDEFRREYKFMFLGAHREVDYSRAPYDARELRETPGARADYTRYIVSTAESSGADVLFTDNFKIVLDQCIEELGVPVVNVHPSVLPLIKGFRPEIRAHQEGDMDSYGYTFHMLTGKLDAGATLFAQRVAPPNEDAEQLETQTSRELFLEEQLRIRAIRAQSEYTARVLAIVASKIPRKLLTGEAAFDAEGRPDFITDGRYRAELEQEARRLGVTQKELPAYSRLVFDPAGTEDYTTIEKILNAPEIADPRIQTGYRTYEVTFPKDDLSWAGLEDALMAAGVHHSSQVVNTGNGFVARITGGLDLGETLTAMGRRFSTDPHPSRVNARRDAVIGIPVPRA